LRVIAWPLRKLFNLLLFCCLVFSHSLTY
jgi:hypothetical protein